MAKTILAVDDSASIRQMVSFTLKSAGYDVVEAVDGQDGLDKAMLTTESSDAMKSQGRAAGATGWLVKPFDPQKLIEVVRKVIG